MALISIHFTRDVNLLFGLIFLFFSITNAQSYGVCYGQVGNNLPTDGEVVALYKAYGIKKMRIYSPKHETLQALRGSNIELILDAPDVLKLASNPSFALRWVQENVVPYSRDVDFRYIAVGNEINPGTEQSRQLLRAMQNVHDALVSASLENRIKVSTATYSLLLADTYPPSWGAFSREAISFMRPIVTFLSNINSPLLVNIYPYFAYVGNPQNIELPYALFTGSRVVVDDGGLKYRNLFDAMLDSTYAALEKAGAADLQIIVSESGWPSSGESSGAATMNNAGTYNANLIKHCASGKGSPRRPGRVIEVYLFAMFDENLKPGLETEKYFGLFTPGKQPKYRL